MLILNILLFLILLFVIVMHYKPDWYQKLTLWFHIRTKYLRPEVSVVELIILACVLAIVVKLYFQIMTNTKHLIHRSLDIGSGLILSIIIQLTIFPYYGIYIDVWAMFHLALIFTVVGITRSYLWSKYVFKYGESK